HPNVLLQRVRAWRDSVAGDVGEIAETPYP
ncbi:MAG: hypothetical protein RJB41_1450, partial [Actinomycetota bacterium]